MIVDQSYLRPGNICRVDTLGLSVFDLGTRKLKLLYFTEPVMYIQTLSSNGWAREQASNWEFLFKGQVAVVLLPSGTVALVDQGHLAERTCPLWFNQDG